MDKITLALHIAGDKLMVELITENLDEPPKRHTLGTFPLPIDDADEIQLTNLWDTNVLVVAP